jgi:hypothetical protein
MNRKKILFLILICLFFVDFAQAQQSEPSIIVAKRLKGKIKFDGILNDSVWKKAPRISNFTQRELDYGKPITEKTEVAVLYDNHNLYFGIWCYQKDASKIVAKFMNPDFDYQSDDNFQIVISPFDDNRTGYLFAINPNGARTDILIFGGEDGNKDWNGVWDARTTITDSGWFAEVIIPFNTLQFKKGKNLTWAINFERDIVSQNEQALWQGWSRDNSIFAVVKAGKLTGLKNISYSKRFELKPYLLVGRTYNQKEGRSFPIKTGGDLNVYLSPTLKLNLTTYTDFAQVEADRIPVNLSRFSVYYPEKRQFFLEGADLFTFYLGDRNMAFYSRQIGIVNHQQVPIIAGARLFGKIGRNNIGFLNMQEAALDTIPTTNNTVLRYKRDLGKQSSIGGIFTNVQNKNHSNQVIGIDATYQTAEFLSNKNLTISARISSSMENYKWQNNALTYRLSIDYPNDFIDNFMAIGMMENNYNPELGYIRRKNYDSYNWHFRIYPRWFTKYGIKKLALKPWSFSLYRTHSTGELESFDNETRPLGAIFKSGDRFEFNLIQHYDRLDEPFALTDNLIVPVGKYMMFDYEIQLESFKSRRIWAFILYNWGQFYGGTKKTVETDLGINFNKHFNLNSSYSWNLVNIQNQKIVTTEMASYLNYAFTTRLNLSLFAQYNSLDNIMIYNFRLHWIPKIGSDFYFVYNIGYNQPIHQIEYLKPETTSAVAKIVYRITF